MRVSLICVCASVWYTCVYEYLRKKSINSKYQLSNNIVNIVVRNSGNLLPSFGHVLNLKKQKTKTQHEWVGLFFQRWRWNSWNSVETTYPVPLRSRQRSSENNALNVWVPLPPTLLNPSLACRKISSCPQHASLSLVKLLGLHYNTSNTLKQKRIGGLLFGHCLSICGPFGTKKVPHRKTHSHLSVQSGSEQECLWFVLHGCRCYFSFPCYKSCWLLETVVMVQPLKTGDWCLDLLVPLRD